jgi:NitT/TauT family transport system substrate-binding protein
MVDKLARFVKASIKGWEYAIAHQDEAVKIVLAADTTGAQTELHQKHQIAEIAKLAIASHGHGLGYLDPAAYERTVSVLLSSGSDPVITKKPDGAWSHAVWEKMGGK